MCGEGTEKGHYPGLPQRSRRSDRDDSNGHKSDYQVGDPNIPPKVTPGQKQTRLENKWGSLCIEVWVVPGGSGTVGGFQRGFCREDNAVILWGDLLVDIAHSFPNEEYRYEHQSPIWQAGVSREHLKAHALFPVAALPLTWSKIQTR